MPDAAAMPEPPFVLQLVPLVVGVVLLAVGVAGLARVLPRLGRLRSAEGVVVGVGKQTLPSPGAAWRLTVAYTDGTGARREAVWVGNSSLDTTRYRPGTPVPVRYDPHDPRWVHLPGSGRPHPLVFPLALCAAGMVALLVSVVLLGG